MKALTACPGVSVATGAVVIAVDADVLVEGVAVDEAFDVAVVDDVEVVGAVAFDVLVPDEDVPPELPLLPESVMPLCFSACCIASSRLP